MAFIWNFSFFWICLEPRCASWNVCVTRKGLSLCLPLSVQKAMLVGLFVLLQRITDSLLPHSTATHTQGTCWMSPACSSPPCPYSKLACVAEPVCTFFVGTCGMTRSTPVCRWPFILFYMLYMHMLFWNLFVWFWRPKSVGTFPKLLLLYESLSTSDSWGPFAGFQLL